MRSVFGILMMVLGILGLLFFEEYDGDFIPYPWIMYLLSFLLIVVGFRLFRGRSIRDDQGDEDGKGRTLDHFKTVADKIEVDLKACRMIANSYSEEVPRSNNERIQAWDGLYDPGNAMKREHVHQVVLEFETTYQGETTVFRSPVIYKDEATLSFLLDAQGTTTLYIDKWGDGSYYFDLEFLLDE